MEKQVRDLDSRVEEIRKMFYEDYLSLREIGKRLGYSGMAIQKVMKRHGYDTSKAALKLKTKCRMCGNEITRLRCQIRNKAIGNFCDLICYHVHLDSISISQNVSRNGMKKGRLVVESILGTLPEGSIVHHIDGDEENNEAENLMLLASQADHLMIHRNHGKPKILFDGSIFKIEEDGTIVMPLASGGKIYIKKNGEIDIEQNP